MTLLYEILYKRRPGFEGEIEKKARSTFSPILYNNYQDFYIENNETKKRTKIGPERIINDIDPISLAFWYMDDGSLTHIEGQEDRATISTCGFNQQDHEILTKALKKFNIEPVVFESKGYLSIRLNAPYAERFFLLIAPYIPPIMQYKLPVRYRGHLGWIPGEISQERQRVIEQQFINFTPDNIKGTGYSIYTELGNLFCNEALIGDDSL